MGLLTERHIGLLTVILGVFKAGGAYVPLDPAYPAPRLRQILDEAGCTTLVVDRAPRAAARRGDGATATAPTPRPSLELEALLDDRAPPRHAASRAPARRRTSPT